MADEGAFIRCPYCKQLVRLKTEPLYKFILDDPKVEENPEDYPETTDFFVILCEKCRTILSIQPYQ